MSVNAGTRRFEIRDGQSVPLPRVPDVSIDDKQGIAKTVHLLGHLARYNFLKDLQPTKAPSSFSPDKFRFEPVDTDGYALVQSAGVYEATDKQGVDLQFESVGRAQNIHIAIFLFNATWGIEKLYPEDGQPTAQVVPGHDPTLPFELTMNIPRGRPEDPPDTIDLFRAYVYAGDHQPSWDELSLPDLPIDASLVPPGLPAEPVLEENVGDDNMSRNVVRQQSSRENWTVLEFRIRTSPS